MFADYAREKLGIADNNIKIAKIQEIISKVPDIPFICMDVANGYSEFFVDAVRSVRASFPNKTIIAGNVVTGEMVEALGHPKGRKFSLTKGCMISKATSS